MNKEKVLVIEDDKDISEMYLNLFSALGYTSSDVATVSSAEEAEMKIKLASLQLLIVNLELPGEDGYGFLHRHKEELTKRGINVFVISGVANPGVEESGEQLGVRLFLSKPINSVNFTLLKDKITQVLSSDTAK